MKYLLISTDEIELIKTIEKLVHDSSKSSVICFSTCLDEAADFLKNLDNTVGHVGVGTNINIDVEYELLKTEARSLKMPIVVLGGNNTIKKNDFNDLDVLKKSKLLSNRPKLDFNINKLTAKDLISYDEDSISTKKSNNKKSHTHDYKYHK